MAENRAAFSLRRRRSLGFSSTNDLQSPFAVNFLFQPAQGLFHWLAFFKSDFGQCLSLPSRGRKQAVCLPAMWKIPPRDLRRENPSRGPLAKTQVGMVKLTRGPCQPAKAVKNRLKIEACNRG